MKKFLVSVIDGYKEFTDIESAEDYVLNIYASSYNNRDCSQDEAFYDLCCELIDIQHEDGTFTEYKDYL
jgi:hypothetical protein